MILIILTASIPSSAANFGMLVTPSTNSATVGFINLAISRFVKWMVASSIVSCSNAALIVSGS